MVTLNTVNTEHRLAVGLKEGKAVHQAEDILEVKVGDSLKVRAEDSPVVGVEHTKLY